MEFDAMCYKIQDEPLPPEKVKSSFEDVLERASVLETENHWFEANKLYTDWLDEIQAFPRKASRMCGSIPPDEAMAIIYNHRGHLKYLLLDFHGALKDYKLGLAKNSLLPILYYNRGTILYRMGLIDKAAEDLLIAHRLEPENPDFNLGLQVCLDKAKTLYKPPVPEDEEEGLEDQVEEEEEDEGTIEEDDLETEEEETIEVTLNKQKSVTVKASRSRGGKKKGKGKSKSGLTGGGSKKKLNENASPSSGKIKNKTKSPKQKSKVKA